jgi:hypothetical protein
VHAPLLASRPARRWMIGKAIISGIPTERVYRQALAGELPRVRALPGLPKRTYYSTLARVRKRLLEAIEPGSKAGGGRRTLEDLGADDDDDGFITRLHAAGTQAGSGGACPVVYPF